MSSKEFMPAFLPPNAIKQCISMAPHDKIPACAFVIGTIKIPGNILATKKWDGEVLDNAANFVLFALSISALGGYEKEHVEGLARLCDIKDLHAREYSDENREWVQSMLLAIDNHNIIGMLPPRSTQQRAYN